MVNLLLLSSLSSNSQKNGRTGSIETLDAKIKSVKQSIKKLNKRLKAHSIAAQAVEKRNLAIKNDKKTKTGKSKKVPELKNSPEFDAACPINGKAYGKTYLQLAKQNLFQKKRQLRMYLDRKSKVIKRGVSDPWLSVVILNLFVLWVNPKTSVSIGFEMRLP
jgi:hypothetical protein